MLSARALLSAQLLELVFQRDHVLAQPHQLEAALVARAIRFVPAGSRGRPASLLGLGRSVILLLLLRRVLLLEQLRCLLQLALVQERQHGVQRGLGVFPIHLFRR